MNHEITMLRTLDPEQHRQGSVLQWIARHGAEHDEQPLAQVAHLRLQLPCAGGTAQVLVEANRWASTCLPALEGSAWNLLPLHALQTLVATSTALPLLPPDLGRAGQITCIGVTTPDAGHVLPVVQGAMGPAWIESIQGDGAAMCTTASPGRTVEISVELRLAQLHLAPAAIAALDCNDVLRLGPLPACGTVWLGGNLIHTFKFKESHVEIDSNLLIDGAREEAAPQDNGATLGSLSITLDVVLAHVPITLNGLQGLCKGSVLELPASAHLNVRVRDAGRLLAVGELVQIGDQLGVHLRSMASSS
ncbi:FliM/FliN family flagellar motor switch protein [Stenotrophomonas sp. B1-1]|uniref:FliM/FliN family flagellar motor switch protein n=1 Tax=Stenotrophomonas sp. B1-1 TaxID=2710648 RepID=UPI0013DD60EE|nr:FliM/FliN family flagellar motor switch protein [Stenotrophomonas sp. B1-1]